MKSTFANYTARTVIVEEAGSVRQMLSDTVRGLGFLDLVVLASGQDALSLLEVEECDWLIMPIMAGGSVNALQMLRVIASTPRLRNVRMSLIVSAQEDAYLPAAFALGAMSCHAKSYLRDDMAAEFKSLIETMKSNDWKTELVAAEYLRRHLIKNKQFATLLDLEQSLQDLFPGSAALLLKLGEAQILSGKVQDGLMTLRQASILDERAKEAADNLTQRILNIHIGNPGHDETARRNVLGIDTCVLIDPDTAVLRSISDLLSSVGVERVETFDNGQVAWEWLSANDEPGLILQEWRISGLPGPMLLQRMRQHGFAKAPVIVISSMIKPTEVSLLREMGVDDIIAKPFSGQSFFKSLIWTIQQNISPTERGSLERKISRLLAADQLAEAERLKAIYLADTRIPTAAKKLVEAEFAFHNGRYRQARDLGIESLRLAGDSLRLLNLIGKSLIKLGDYGAALKFFEKAHALSPLNIEHICNLAVSQFDAGDGAAAEAAIQKARRLDPANQMAGEMECELAILARQTTKARELMKKLPSMLSIVGYMNNRAVALSRCGQYEEGIKLYLQTAESLPADATDMRDIVAYNLGLAYARYGELPKAQEQLQSILKRPDSPLLKKAQSLFRRITEALEKGSALTFVETAPDEFEVAEGDDPAESRAAIAAALEIRRGDICLYGIFEDKTPDDGAKKLLENTPRFVERSAINRPEAMTRIN